MLLDWDHRHPIAYAVVFSSCVRVRLNSLGTRLQIGLLYQPQMTADDECGAVSGMGIGRGNRSTWSLPQCHFVHHKSHMT
jgi:hypothetical protein